MVLMHPQHQLMGGVSDVQGDHASPHYQELLHPMIHVEGLLCRRAVAFQQLSERSQAAQAGI